MKNLRPREKWLVAIGGLVVVLFLGWSFFAQPAIEEINRLEASVIRHQKELDRLKLLIAEWRQIEEARKSLSQQLAGREANFSLAAYIEEAIRSSGLSGYLSDLRPLPAEDAPGGLVRISVEAKFKGAPWEGMIDLLHKIEYSEKMLTVTRFSAVAGSSGLEVTLRVLTLAKR